MRRNNNRYLYGAARKYVYVSFLTFHKTSKRAAPTLSNFYNVPSLAHFFLFFLFFCSLSYSLLPHCINVIACLLDDVFVDYIYSRRNPRRCSVAIYRRTTSTSSLVLATRRPPSMRSCTEMLSTGCLLETTSSFGSIMLNDVISLLLFLLLSLLLSTR